MPSNLSCIMNGTQHTQTVWVDGQPFVNPVLLFSASRYHLAQHEFETLLKDESKWYSGASYFLSAFVAFALNIIAKLIGEKFGITSFDLWEPIACGIALICWLVCLLFNTLCGNKKRKLVNLIQSYFENNP